MIRSFIQTAPGRQNRSKNLKSENIPPLCFRLEDGEDACTEARYELKEKNKVFLGSFK